MPDEYTDLVEALKTLTQEIANTGKPAETALLPMAEDEWYTRPDTVSYGIVSLDFEDDALEGDDRKVAASYEGSVDLFSLVKNGAGWVPMIRQTLTDHCGPSWKLNFHGYERETGLYHWEWTFQIEE